MGKNCVGQSRKVIVEAGRGSDRETAAGLGDLFLDGRGRCAAHSFLREHHDRFGRTAARHRTASPVVGMLSARARSLQPRPQAVFTRECSAQDDWSAGKDLRPRGSGYIEAGSLRGHHRLRSRDDRRNRDLGKTHPVRARHRRHHREWGDCLASKYKVKDFFISFSLIFGYY